MIINYSYKLSHPTPSQRITVVQNFDHRGVKKDTTTSKILQFLKKKLNPNIQLSQFGLLFKKQNKTGFTNETHSMIW